MLACVMLDGFSGFSLAPAWIQEATVTQQRSTGTTDRMSDERPLAIVSHRGPLGEFELRLENSAYRGTGGVSENNRESGFLPAYRNIRTGQTVLSRFSDGRPAPIHVLDGVPQDWVVARDDKGRVRRVLATVVSGFLHHGRFYTREDAARALGVENPA